MNELKFIDQNDIYLFNTGNAQRAYYLMGCHYVPEMGAHRFCVWAPNARSVSVVGSFNNWNESLNVMQRQEGGVFYAFIKGIQDGNTYKYRIVGYDGEVHYKAVSYTHLDVYKRQ